MHWNRTLKALWKVHFHIRYTGDSICSVQRIYALYTVRAFTIFICGKKNIWIFHIIRSIVHTYYVYVKKKSLSFSLHYIFSSFRIIYIYYIRTVQCGYIVWKALYSCRRRLSTLHVAKWFLYETGHRGPKARARIYCTFSLLTFL